MRRPTAPAIVTLAVVITAVTACSGAPPAASPAPVGTAAPARTVDPPAPCSASTSISGWSDALDGTTFDGKSVANLSGLAALPDGSVLALSDRSILFTLDPTATRTLAAEPLVGPDGAQLDSEAVVENPDGTRMITDETGPEVLHYRPDGTFLDQLPVPAALAVAPAGRSTANKTFEGLARQPDGSVVASLEEPLAGDDPGLTRLVTWTPTGAPSAQYALPLPDGLSVSEITAVGDGRLLVIERAYRKGVGNTVHLVLADPRGAPDVAAVADLTPTTPPVRTTLLADLGACPTLGATNREQQANPLLDNVEGMTITGRDPDGALRLLLVSDNNSSTAQTTRTYRLRTTLPPA